MPALLTLNKDAGALPCCTYYHNAGAPAGALLDPRNFSLAALELNDISDVENIDFSNDVSALYFYHHYAT